MLHAPRTPHSGWTDKPGHVTRSGADWHSDTLCVRRPRTGPADPLRLCDAVPGLEVSPSHLPQHVVVQLLVREEPLEPGVLLLQGLQPDHVFGSHRLVLDPPALIRLHRDLQVPTHPRDIFSLG